jgi:hypothetical protein
MNEPIESCLRTASTPAQAKVFVAMLRAEGIPARVDGDTLTDEFATSRLLLNLSGTRVMVPTTSLARAAEILQPMQVDAAELEREALAAPLELAPPPRSATAANALPAPPSSSGLVAGVLLLLALGAAVWFVFAA